MRFRVKALPKAEADVRGIANYIYERSPQGAAAWLDAYREARLRLGEDADIYGPAAENDHFDIEAKQLLFKTRHGRNYRLIYTLAEEDVRILRVRGPGQASIKANEINEYGN